VDQIDWQIVKRLQQDARTPYTTIAAELGIAEGTVRHRVSRLVEEGYVRLAAVLNPLRLGKQTMAIVGLRVHGDAGPQVVETLRSFPEVRYAAFCAGEYDLIIQIVVPSNDELFHFLTGRLREVQGISSSDTSLILRTCVEFEDWLPWPQRPEAQ
jgi:Lrp/AsnC family transcriptional regulator for asnA, asnC and gidA